VKRFIIFDNYNTAYDWGLLLTAKVVSDPEPKTNYQELGGVSGTLDLTEALTGEVTYNDRQLTASFSMSDGTVQEREAVLRQITAALHGRRVRIVEPDDPEHYLVGRVKIVGRSNTHAYATLDVEATCEPWRYAVNESERRVVVKNNSTDVVICNAGSQTVCPVIAVTGNVSITDNGVTTALTSGSYKITDIRLKPGANVIGVSGYGSATFIYREAVL
jgi:hypothetical protein